MLTIFILAILLSLLVYAVSYGLVYLAFGADGVEIKKRQGKKLFGWSLFLWAFLRIYLSSIRTVFSEAFPPLFTLAFLCSFPVIYGVFVFFARRWTKNAIEEQQKTRAEERKWKAALEEKEKLAQQERENKEKAQKDALVKAFTEEAGTMQVFTENARACTTFSEVLALWDSLTLEESEVAENIHNQISSAVKRERMYGSIPREITAFLDELQQTYADAVLKAQLQEAQKKEPLKGLDALKQFVEESREEKNFAQMLTLWKDVDVGDQNVHEEILQNLTSLAKSERIYGSSPREKETFLNQLLAEYGETEAN